MFNKNYIHGYCYCSVVSFNRSEKILDDIQINNWFSKVIDVMTNLNAHEKINKESNISNSFDISIVNALSKRLELTIFKNGHKYILRFEKGVLVENLKKIILKNDLEKTLDCLDLTKDIELMHVLGENFVFDLSKVDFKKIQSEDIFIIKFISDDTILPNVNFNLTKEEDRLEKLITSSYYIKVFIKDERDEDVHNYQPFGRLNYDNANQCNRFFKFLINIIIYYILGFFMILILLFFSIFDIQWINFKIFMIICLFFHFYR